MHIQGLDYVYIRIFLLHVSTVDRRLQGVTYVVYNLEKQLCM